MMHYIGKKIYNNAHNDLLSFKSTFTLSRRILDLKRCTNPHARQPIPCCRAAPRRAAQYVRMSTEHQQYSTENQADHIK